MGRNLAHGTGPRPETTVMRWGEPKNAEKTAWMLANAGTQHSIPEVIDMFEREFGIRLNRTQVSQFRASHEMQRRRGTIRDDRWVPVGTESVRKGFTVVKVRENPAVKGSKDNWVIKQRWVYEQNFGPIPPRHNILFGDGDRSNFSPDNLVAVPVSKMRMLNNGRYEWHSADELRVALALVDLDRRAAQLDAGMTRVCGVCGREFVPDLFKGKDGEVRSYAVNKCTCRECLSKGLKARGEPKVTYERVCPVCGRTFLAAKRNVRRCPECVERMPTRSPEQQRRIEGRE